MRVGIVCNSLSDFSYFAFWIFTTISLCMINVILGGHDKSTGELREFVANRLGPGAVGEQVLQGMLDSGKLIVDNNGGMGSPVRAGAHT